MTHVPPTARVANKLQCIDVKNVGKKIKNVKNVKNVGKIKKTFKNVIKNVDATVI